jgi:molecular chaperone HscA
MPAGLARLEVSLHVDENSLLGVHARELTTGIEQRVEVKPSYGLSEDEIEDMLIEALDHGEEDLERRRQAEAMVEAQRVMLATDKALASDADLLRSEEREGVEQALARLRQSVTSSAGASALQLHTQQLDDATHGWAGRRMDRAIQQAIGGKAVVNVARAVEHARGVDAHVAEHQASSAGSPPSSEARH